jgi:ribonuclease HII
LPIYEIWAGNYYKHTILTLLRGNISGETDCGSIFVEKICRFRLSDQNAVYTMSTLASFYLDDGLTEAGCDEAGRGCLAGPVFAAAVILPKGYHHPLLNDSKQMTERHREQLRELIEREAEGWAVAQVSAAEIDRMNILQASYEAMHRALNQLTIRPERLLIDGNRFRPYGNVPHHCLVKGDARFAAIAAASVLAKTHRDAYMQALSLRHPEYGWAVNKGYPTQQHRMAIQAYGATDHHRRSFRLLPERTLFG